MTKKEAREICYDLAEEYVRKVREENTWDDDLEEMMVAASRNFDGYEYNRNEIMIAIYDNHISVDDETFYWEDED